MIIKELICFKYRVKKILNKMNGVNKWRNDFMIEVFTLYLSIKGRGNFLQLERFGDFDEHSYRDKRLYTNRIIGAGKISILAVIIILVYY